MTLASVANSTGAVGAMARPIVVSLFDHSANMVRPWADAGHPCAVFDMQHPPGVSQLAPNIVAIGGDIRDVPNPLPFAVRIAFAFPPCDHLAVSGARWFKGKGLRALSDSIELFAEAAERLDASGAPYMIENPVSTISTYWRKPDHTFDPADYSGYARGDAYTKKTCLWVGNGFVMPQPARAEGVTVDTDRIWKASAGPGRKRFRSVTPIGFARAVFAANGGSE